MLPEREILIRIGILVAREHPLVLLTEVNEAGHKLLEADFECLHFGLQFGNGHDLTNEINQLILSFGLLLDCMNCIGADLFG